MGGDLNGDQEQEYEQMEARHSSKHTAPKASKPVDEVEDAYKQPKQHNSGTLAQGDLNGDQEQEYEQMEARHSSEHTAPKASTPVDEVEDAYKQPKQHNSGTLAQGDLNGDQEQEYEQ